jgi:hypothetical protein
MILTTFKFSVFTSELLIYTCDTGNNENYVIPKKSIPTFYCMLTKWKVDDFCECCER